ncbi:uncharacterized protein Z518_04862 [Rhinocladiella mackenziei CBS 650.93]|uniref:Rhinocladiella mackenziei CBS 650.93 unplaced genomic scaffold supercont1.3, whole genome shotgun sequence n=1 Tax=Rhinocladiella mackenziei CBS 650.93 TaxID=1442369 RepID=A0A0D2IUP7_9EURO|nr:uncharacterized protein Z518_04862 [Rhinocladiella mackenziei CBS 650.93]KIX06886.1 hypothetical protein Z518_04862 [Rhinocladiella mackenziei CBS 650.93]
MKAFSLSALSTLFAGLTLAHPVDLKARSGFSDVDITILQFALTLEHLENTFYQQAFNTFTLQHFLDAGFDEDFFLNLQFIASDESAHVELLQVAIQSAGIVPVAPCQYSFPVTDVASFVTLSAILESVGTSAYLGAAPFVGSKDILAVAASIMVTEALHTSLQRSSLGGIGAADPFGTSLDANSVFTLAAQFIVSCPPENPPLPFTAFPGLQVDAQPCFGEDSFATSAVEAAVTDVASATATYSTDTATVTDYVAAANATETAAETATETASATESTMEMAMETPAPERLRARTDSLSCAAPFAGSNVNLIPDFGASSHDFSQIVTIFVTFVSGLNVISVAATISSGTISVSIPSGIGGQVFIFITIIDITGGKLSDSDVLFGPAIMEVAPAVPSLGH